MIAIPDPSASRPAKGFALIIPKVDAINAGINFTAIKPNIPAIVVAKTPTVVAMSGRLLFKNLNIDSNRSTFFGLPKKSINPKTNLPVMILKR